MSRRNETEHMLIREAERIGMQDYEFRRLSKHHSFRFQCPDGRIRMVVYSASASDHRETQNTKRDLLKMAREGGYKC